MRHKEEAGMVLMRLSEPLKDDAIVVLLGHLHSVRLMLLTSPRALADATVRKFLAVSTIQGLVSTEDMLQFTENLPAQAPLLVHCRGLNGSIELPASPSISIFKLAVKLV